MLRFLLRTPHALVAEFEVCALRVPTDTGQVGLRPRHEAILLAVEAGLVHVQTREGLRFAGTAGGLLRSDGTQATLLTSDAVVGEDASAVLALLDRALAAPDPEREIRRAIERLGAALVQEMRGRTNQRERLRP
jgi:F0F1-type ATP synthase epsilon subunit